MPPRFIVFDFDGTLADSMPFFLEHLEAVARTHGFRSFAADDVDTLRGMGTRQLLVHAGLPWWKLPGVSRDYRRRMSACADSIPLFDGVPAMLEALARHMVIGIVTSNSRDNVQTILGEAMRHVSFGEYAAAFLGKTTRLRRVCRQAGVTPAQALYVGDEERDIQAARASGMRSGAVLWGYATQAVLEAACPDYLFQDTASVQTQLLAAS